jgi:hypothetical protein
MTLRGFVSETESTSYTLQEARLIILSWRYSDPAHVTAAPRLVGSSRVPGRH